MLLFMILLVIVIILAVITVLAISIGGAAFIVVFGDVIICILIIAWIIHRLFRKK